MATPHRLHEKEGHDHRRPIKVWFDGVGLQAKRLSKEGKTISSRANRVMQMSTEGMSVRKVSRITMVHCAEPPPGLLTRNSLDRSAWCPIESVSWPTES